MIVKDEAEVIGECLASVKPLIDYWVIVDTGSSDDTRDVIEKTLAEIPGELHQRPWVNFAHNRNEALELAKNKGDYVLLIDADEVLQYSKDFVLPPLEKDLYYIIVRQVGAAHIKRNGLINNHLQWTWRGVIHEFITCPDAKTAEVLPGIINICNPRRKGVSGRSRESEKVKYLRDAKILEQALQDEPDNSRYAYYLGISYAAAGEPELAKKSFEKRIAMASTDLEENYSAAYNLGVVELELNNADAARRAFYRANSLRPARAEPLLQLAKIYRQENNVLLGYLLSKHALSLPYPTGDLCVEYVVYDHTLLIEFANCALLLEKFDEGLDACDKLLANPNLPSEFRPHVRANYELARKKLASMNRPPHSPVIVGARPAGSPHSASGSPGNDGPIFIGGAQRSGTTLMRVMLDCHPRICCGVELMVLPVVAEHYKFLTGRNLEVMHSYGNTRSDVQRYCRAFVEDLVETFRRRAGKPRWAEKTPQNILYMVLLGEIFPDAKFIHMLRDGRDVACSLVTMDWIDKTTGRKFEFVESITGAARYWRDMVTRGRQQAAHPSLAGRVLEVRYEALVTEPAATMRQVLAFVGEDWDDAVLSHHTKHRPGEVVEPSTAQVTKPLYHTAVHRWQHDMTEADKAAFKAQAGDLLTELGYADTHW
ncbi:sulfotransferase [Mycobacterium sp.]|uniref:sulfotransferase n=1 Tax=Mycobacterium sp. TaxID=1785 RepID=UPI0025F39F5C|nr:sulfotransferase [Mycobacterium sp.]